MTITNKANKRTWIKDLYMFAPLSAYLQNTIHISPSKSWYHYKQSPPEDRPKISPSLFPFEKRPLYKISHARNAIPVLSLILRQIM